MRTFEITLRRKSGESWPVVVEIATGDLTPIRNEGSFSYSLEELLSTGSTVEGYGTALGQALFQGPIRSAFERALAGSGEERLRVLLFVEDAALHELRWERLCAPFDYEDWRLLATAQQAPFSHYLPSLTDRRFPPIGRRDLRALIVACSPQPGEPRFQKLPAFDEAEAIRGVQAALGDAWTLLGHGPDAAGPPTLNQICQRITAEPYSILHIVCHGAVIEGGETALYLAKEGAPEQIEPVTGKLLIDRLKGLRGARGLPHLCFLSSCESAKTPGPDSQGNFGGLAQRLVRELGMPAVVAMTEKVSIVTANTLSEQFYQQLLQHGEVDSALTEATAGLQGRYDVTVPVLFNRLGGRPLWSDSLERDPSDGEIAAGLEQLRALVAVRAPTLSDELEAAAAALVPALGPGLAGLSPEARGNRVAALAELDAICQEAADMTFGALAMGREPPPYDATCPFPGLSAFQAAEQRFFFGREQMVARLRERLAAHPFLAVLGLSGSGKSSVVRAGLLPALEEQTPGLRVATLTPGATPLASLEAALGEAAGLVFVDQFEELFTLCADEAGRRAFVERLAALHAAGTPIVLTMRADFWGEVAPYPFLREQMQAHQELVPPLSPEELGAAMEQQARAVGLRFEADLASRILDDVRGEPGAMPLLQHALQQLWQRRRGRWLRAGEYREIGGLQRAISHSAEQVYAAAVAQAPENAGRLRGIFLRLTRVDAEGGEGARDTRQRVAEAELIPAGADSGPTLALVQRLVAARLLVTSSAPDGGRLVEVAHEALIRSWPRLRAWIDEDRTRLRLLAAIREAAREWAARQDDSLLLYGARLEEARALAAEPRFQLNAAEQAFIQASLQAAAQALRTAYNQLMIADAQAALFRDDPDQALALIHALTQIDPQSSEAYRLLAEAIDRSARAVFTVEAGWSVNSAAFTAEGDLAVGCNSNGAVVVWNTASGEEVRRLNDPERPDVYYTTVVVTPDGAAVFAAGEDGVISVWSMADGSLRRLGADAENPLIRNLAYIPKRKLLLAAHDDGSVAGWQLPRGKLAFRKQLAEGSIWGIAVTPDGKKVLLSDPNGPILLWDLDDDEVQTFEREGRAMVSTLAVSPDGALFAAGDLAGQIEIWDLAQGGIIDSHVVHEDTIHHVAFDSSGAKVLSCSEDQSIKLSELPGFRLIRAFDGHAAPVYRAVLSADDRQVLSASFDNTMRLWNTESPFLLSYFSCGEPMIAAAFSPDGKLLAASSQYGSVLIWELQSGELRHQLTSSASPDLPVTDIFFSADSKTLSARIDYEHLSAWRVADGVELDTVPEQDRPRVCYAVAPNGRLGATGYGKEIAIYDLQDDAKIIATIPGHMGEVHYVDFSPTFAMLVSVSEDRTVRLWSIDHEPLAFREVGQLIGHNRSINQAAFSPNGQLIATASNDRSVRLWHVANGQELQRFFGHTRAVKGLAFNPTKTELASVSQDGTVRLWTISDPASLVEFVAKHRWLPPLTAEQRARYGLDTPA